MLVSGRDIGCCATASEGDWIGSEEKETDGLGWMKSEASASLSWDTPDLPVVSEFMESVEQMGAI